MSKTLRRLRYLMATTGLVLACAISLAAQGGSLRGQLTLPSGESLNESVRISLQTSRGMRAIVFTDNRGRFQFAGLNPGQYQLVVEGDKVRYDDTTATVEIFPGAPSILNVVLKERKSSSGSRGGGNSVSASELDPAIPARAKKEFERATVASNEGKPDEAIDHLRQAIAIYPRYLMAHNDLGAQLLGEGKLDEAAEELRQALEIDPKAFNPHLNLGIVLVQQQKFSEAAKILQVAVSLNSGAPAARLYNGMALQGLNELDTAKREFEAAHELGGPTFAVALFHLGQILLSKGERQKAVAAFEGYLHEAPHGSNASEAKSLLATLR
jgi:tetratricopeptide (TPR) repeat protein